MKESNTKASEAFSAEERAAMREHVKEAKSKVQGEQAVLEKIAEMPEADRVMAERIHALVKDVAPELTPKTWYGQPAYAKDGQVVCFFQAAAKFNTRYATFGFNEAANLDDGSMWATAFALKALTPGDEAKLAELIRKAAG